MEYFKHISQEWTIPTWQTHLNIVSKDQGDLFKEHNPSFPLK